jgi:nicotinate (nicotinamide) nucleotide adenylyltransferase
MQFFRRANRRPSRLGVLPGAFNPLTVAHLALANAALTEVDEVVFVLPQVFPHKHYWGASFEQRVAMLTASLDDECRFSIASSEQGLFVEIAAECAAAYGPGVRLSFLCGRDAAERIAGWDYGQGIQFADTLRGFDLLVAARGGEFQPPSGLGSRIRPLALGDNCDAISATDIRRRIAAGEPWEDLVPPAIRRQVLEIYGATGRDLDSLPKS